MTTDTAQAAASATSWDDLVDRVQGCVACAERDGSSYCGSASTVKGYEIASPFMGRRTDWTLKNMSCCS